MPLDFYSRIEVALASLSTIRLDDSGIRVLALNESSVKNRVSVEAPSETRREK
jgi:hypothetical protein